MTESRFRERRSAHRDELGSEPAEPAAPTAPASTSTLDTEPGARVEPTGPAKPVEPAEPAIPAEPAKPAESMPGRVEPTERMEGPAEEAGMDLDGLAEMDVPEPSFLELVEPHVEMALRFLGELPLTPDGERRVLPRWAKREIDLLGLLEERTRGNLPPPEQGYLEQALDHLRTLYLKAGP